MPNVITLIKEDRVRRQVELFCSELGYDNLQLSHFKNSHEFEQTYFKASPNPEAQVFLHIHMIVVALECIDGKVGPWIDRIQKSLSDFKLIEKGTQVRLVLMKYEDDNVNIQELIHPKVDDLLLLPLDRSVFLQKMDIILNLPRKVNGRFLFSQDVNFNVEISKISKLDRLSDVGLAIRNPIALRVGVPAHFYVEVPGEKEYLSLYGKVFRSEPHPDFAKQFLVYFNYISLSRNDLTRIRRLLGKSAQYKSLIDENPEKFRFDERNIFITEDQRRLQNVVILDPDEKSGASIRNILVKDLDHIHPIYENSYSLFLHKYFRPKAKDTATPPRTVEPTDLYVNPLKIVVDGGSKSLVQAEKNPEPGEVVLGHSANDIFSTTEGWLKLFPSKESMLVIEETLSLARQGKRLRKVVVAHSAIDEPCGLSLLFSPLPEHNQVSITIEPASAPEIAENIHFEDTPPTIDALIVDSAYIPHDVATWVEWLKKRAMAARLLKHEGSLKIIVLTEKEIEPPAKWLNQKEIVAVFAKPLDVRQFCFTIGEALENRFTPYQFSNIGWAQPNLFVHSAKESYLESLSEYGVTLRSDRPIAPGNFVYLRKSIYQNAPSGCLAARIYSTNEHPSEKGQFQCHATYFGINDLFLKYARTWIREHYASQKKERPES